MKALIVLYLHGWEANCHYKVSAPVDEHSHGHGCRPRPLGEQLCSDHPGDGAGANSKEDDIEQGWHDGEPPNPGDKFLKIQFGVNIGVLEDQTELYV